MADEDEGLIAGRYRRLGHIGAGGMARVYLAEDEKLGRKVAVKRLHSDSPADAAGRFEREARLGASLNHPNLVSVYDIETEPESVLIVMEYVEGQTLRELLARRAAGDRAGDLGGARHRRGARPRPRAGRGPPRREAGEHPDPPRRRGEAGRPRDREGRRVHLAHPLRHGGGHGLLHGARAARRLLGRSRHGRLRAGRRDVRGARGARRPATASTPVEIAHQVATDPTPDLRREWENAPAGAAEVLKRGMARDPADRPDSAGRLARELEEGLRAAPPRPPPRSPTTRTAPPRCRPPPPRPARRRPRRRRRRGRRRPSALRGASQAPAARLAPRGRPARRILAVVADRRARVRRRRPSSGERTAGVRRRQAQQETPSDRAADRAPADRGAAGRAGARGAAGRQRGGTDPAEGAAPGRPGVRLIQQGDYAGGDADRPPRRGLVPRGRHLHQLRLRAVQPGHRAQPLGQSRGGDPATSRSG